MVSMPIAPQPLSRTKLLAYIVLALIGALFLHLSMHGMGVYHFSADEMMHIGMARGESIGEVWRFSAFEPHPPLGNILRHYWLQFSQEVGFVRSQSLLFGLLTIVLSYRIGTLVGSPLTGICVAAVAAFCPPLILQSYIARNYAFFVFFLSAAFYCYLRYEQSRWLKWLLAYGLMGTFACLTNFSAVFTIFCMAALGCWHWQQRSGSRATLAQWIAVHLAMAAITIVIWQLFLPSGIEPYQHHVRTHLPAEWNAVVYYPQQLVTQLLPYPFSWRYSYWLLVGIMVLLLVGGQHAPKLRAYVVLLMCSVFVGSILLITNIYPLTSSRHLLWIFPFFVLGIGGALGALLEKLHYKRSVLAYCCMAMLPIAGWVSYDPENRFNQLFEYQITKDQWQATIQKLSTLNRRHVLIARRVDALLLDPPQHNPYRAMQHDPALITQVPYYQTMLLFNPVRNHPRHYSSDLQFHMVRAALDKGLLDQVDTLVFINSAWSSRISSSMVTLALCDAFPKTIWQTPTSQRTEQKITNMYKAPITIILMDKKLFVDEVLASGATARGCLP